MDEACHLDQGESPTLLTLSTGGLLSYEVSERVSCSVRSSPALWTYNGVFMAILEQPDAGRVRALILRITSMLC